MHNCAQLAGLLLSGALDNALTDLYAPDGGEPELEHARSRTGHVLASFKSVFGQAHTHAALFSGPGRTELGGNHTDHQHGHVLCASVDLDILAAAAPNGTNALRVLSEGYPAVEVLIDSLAPRMDEKNTSAALIRGVAAGVRELGYSLCGLDIYAVSNVLSGSGLSSSAAFEVLLGNIFNHFCCCGALDAVTIAKIGQRAENIFFGKPCGLMDQMGSSCGGAVAIDFAEPAAPLAEPICYDFSRSQHALCIIDTGSSHDGLTDEYAAIPREMGEVAAFFGREYLRDVPESDFLASLASLREKCADRAVLRAMHFYGDNRRAVDEAEALKLGDFTRFLTLVNQSGRSSESLLQNISPAGAARDQSMALALALARSLLGDEGAARVHGGGFAGTIQAFVPSSRLAAFKAGIEAVLGQGKCHVLRIRPQGGCVVFD